MPTAHTTGAGFVTASLQSALRTILQFFRTPQLLMLGTIQGALFLFMFRYIFGGAIDPGEGLEYVDFLVPGFLADRDPVDGDGGELGHRRGRHHRGPRPAPVAADPTGVGDVRAVARRHDPDDVGTLRVPRARARRRVPARCQHRRVRPRARVARVLGLLLHVGVHHDRSDLEERSGGQRDVHPDRRPALVHLRRVRAGRLAARVAAAHRRTTSRSRCSPTRCAA